MDPPSSQSVTLCQPLPQKSNIPPQLCCNLPKSPSSPQLSPIPRGFRFLISSELKSTNYVCSILPPGQSFPGIKFNKLLSHLRHANNKLKVIHFPASKLWQSSHQWVNLHETSHPILFKILHFTMNSNLCVSPSNCTAIIHDLLPSSPLLSAHTSLLPIQAPMLHSAPPPDVAQFKPWF